MKRIALGFVLATLTAVPVLADSYAITLPRLDFPSQGAEVTQGCNTLVQACR